MIMIIVLAASESHALAQAPPLIAISAPRIGEYIPVTGTLFTGTATGSSGIQLVRIYVYDYGRRAYTLLNAPAAYDSSAQQWSLAILPAYLTPGSLTRLWVQAIDGAGNASAWLFWEGMVQDSTPRDLAPPTVAILQPAASATVAASGFLFAGTATDSSGVQLVRIYVYDYGRSMYTLVNAPALYDADTQQWNLGIQAAQLSPGMPVRLWVQAVDSVGNASAWLFREERVSSPPVETLGPSLVAISGTQMLVALRQRDGTLLTAAPMKLRGVNYSPVDAGETVSSLDDARTHMRDSRYAQDFELLQYLGANAIRTYVDMGTDGVATAILNEAYNRKLMMLVTLADVAPSEVTRVVNAYKDHPALLGWSIGNEWNLNLFFQPSRFPTVQDAAVAVEQAAQLIHSLDSNHPVVSGLGFALTQNNLGPSIAQSEFADIVALAPSVESWALNVYRSKSFDPLFFEWGLLSQRPMLISEFGTDGWNQQTGRLDDQLQMETAAALWEEIHRHLSASHPGASCLGGFAFEWSDEWWKAGTPATQGAGGFPSAWVVHQQVSGLPLATFRGHPDGFSNEEHYGIVHMQRYLKPAFYALREAFSLTTVQQAPVQVETVSVGGGAVGYSTFSKRGQPISVVQTDGFHAVTIDRSTGTVRDMKRFDTVGNPQQACLELAAYADAVAVGDVVLLAVSQNALPNDLTMQAAPMAPCVEALGRLGGQRALEIDAQEPWALIAIAGPLPLNLAEMPGALSDTVHLTADVFLDADRDGLTDDRDSDNDGDEVFDAVERVHGTDVLDPTSF